MEKEFFQSEICGGKQCAETYGEFEKSNGLHTPGMIDGNVVCEGMFNCSGIVNGNIKAGQVQLYRACIKGNITCRTIMTDDLSYVQGIIVAESGSVNCRVGGRVTITGNENEPWHKETVQQEL